MSTVKVVAEKTPNPQTMTFRFSQNLLDRTAQFDSAGDTFNSPLAAKLFGFPWTSQVYLGEDFVSVTKQEWVDWDVLAEPLTGLIQEHLQMGIPLMIETTPTVNEDDISESDSPVVRSIKQLLIREIRPVVALDGGDVSFVKFEEGTLFLKFKGACSGCASQEVTLKQGIEVRFKESIPEVREVLSI